MEKCVGGLPYIVDRFISTNDMNIVYQEQHDIIEEYRDDFGIINLCHNLNNISDPLEGNKIDNIFKVYMQDSGLEIDFVSKVNNEISLIEVKATTGNTKSAKTVLKNPQYDVNVCYKLSENNIGVVNNIITVPYYMTFLL